MRQNVHEELIRANRGRPVPFLLSGSTNPSFSVYGRVQSGIHPDEAYGSRTSNRAERAKIYEDEPFSPSVAKILNGHREDNRSFVERVKAPSPSRAAEKATTPIRKRRGAPASSFGSGSDIDTVRLSMEQELEALKDEYSRALALATEDPSFDKLHLARLIDAMDAKSQHIHLLVRYKDASEHAKPRSPVRSPGAYKHKVKQLRLLRQFRDQDDDDESY